MSDYAERLRGKMSESSVETLPSSPYAPIGIISNTPDPAPSLQCPTSNKRQYLAVFAATIGNLLMGTCIAWSGPAIPGLKLPPSEDGFDITDSEGSWIGSLMPLGALLGGPLGGAMIGKLGKKGAMFINAGLYAVAYLLIVVAPSLWMIYIGRFLSGIATGISSLVCPVYVAEISKAEIRGFLGSGVQVMVTIGVLMSIAVGAVLSWRWLSVVCLSCVLLWSLVLLLIPDSPGQYIANKKYREARESLEWLRESIYVESEFEEIQRGVEDSLTRSSTPSDLLKSQNLAPLIISMYLMLGQQLSGMNAVIFYVVDIFNAAGSSIPPNIESIIVGLVQVLATILGALVMDKLGRRMLLNLSSALMVVSISALGLYFYIKINLGNTDLATKIEILPVASLSIFVFAFSVGFGPIPWLMMSELFSPEIRSLASSLATTFNWTLAFMVTKFFSDLVGLITEAGSFWVFGGITGLTFLFCLFLVPETKGRSLEAIQQMFRSSSPYFLEIGIWRLCRSRSSEDNQVLVDEVDEEA